MFVECVGVFDPFPDAAREAAVDGHSVVAFCSGVSWWWRSEDRDPAMGAKYAAH